MLVGYLYNFFGIDPLSSLLSYGSFASSLLAPLLLSLFVGFFLCASSSDVCFLKILSSVGFFVVLLPSHTVTGDLICLTAPSQSPSWHLPDHHLQPTSVLGSGPIYPLALQMAPLGCLPAPHILNMPRHYFHMSRPTQSQRPQTLKSPLALHSKFLISHNSLSIRFWVLSRDHKPKAPLRH